jgi:hypothetical protein
MDRHATRLPLLAARRFIEDLIAEQADPGVGQY